MVYQAKKNVVNRIKPQPKEKVPKVSQTNNPIKLEIAIDYI